jgi:hypothetical protein
MTAPLDLPRLVAYLRERHACHTVLLYGSVSRGEDGPESDVDVMGFREGGPSENDTSDFEGRRLDVWIKPVAELTAAVEGGAEPREAFLHVAGGIPLADPQGLLAKLLEAVGREAEAPVPMDPKQREFLSGWCRKMVKRAEKGDSEGDFRLHWLLNDSLGIAFRYLERRYPGPKAALRELARLHPDLHARFVSALRPGASLDDVRRLLDGMDEL